MKFMVRFECRECEYAVDMFTDVTVQAHRDEDSMGNVSYEYDLHPEKIPDDWKNANKCGSCS